MTVITLNSYTYCLQDSYFYLNLTKLATQFIKIFKMLGLRQCSFLLKKIQTVGTPKPTLLLIIFRVFIWLISFINAGEKIHFLRFEILLQAEGQDNLRKKVITMEILRRLLIMKQHPNIRKVLGQISMPTSMHLWSRDVNIL